MRPSTVRWPRQCEAQLCLLTVRIMCRLPEVWPSDGAIAVQSLVVRYRSDLDPVLNGITFSVKGIGDCSAIRLLPAAGSLSSEPTAHSDISACHSTPSLLWQCLTC